MNYRRHTNCLFTDSFAVRLLLAGGLWWIAAANHATAASVTAFWGDDWHTSTTDDHAGIQYSCPWIDTGLTSFKAANAGWDFKYAGANAAAFLANDLKVVANGPWVVNQPTFTKTFTNADGSTTPKTWGGNLNGEAGGAYLEMSYTPKGNDPVNIRWIQAIASIYRGGAYNVHLDNPDDKTAPFYDFGARDTAGPTWFDDIPGAREKEYEGNPVASVDFQAFLAQDNGAGNGFTHNVTIYGGIWWDYTYTAVDGKAPEPSSLGMGGLLLLGLLGRRKFFRRGRRQTEKSVPARRFN